MADRDLFANFDRMRREMDEMFSDAFGRAGMPRRRAAHWPPVDVAYASDPPRAIVTAELAGVDSAEVALQIQGRTLVLTGRRRAPSPEGEVYQQVEIERGVFRRLVELGADVVPDAATARYENGMLRVQLPLVQRSGRPRAVPIESADDPDGTGDREPAGDPDGIEHGERSGDPDGIEHGERLANPFGTISR